MLEELRRLMSGEKNITVGENLDTVCPLRLRI